MEPPPNEPLVKARYDGERHTIMRLEIGDRKVMNSLLTVREAVIAYLPAWEPHSSFESFYES
jgi:hypothetical protein